MRVALLVVVLGACGRIGFESARDPHAVEVDAFETASPTFVAIDDATLVIPPSQARWLVVTTATLQSTSLDHETGAELRYTVDGVERGIGGTQNAALDRPGPFQHFVVLDGTAATQTVAFELRDDGGGVARVEQLRAYAVPLGASALYHEADAIVELATEMYVPAATFTIAEAGEYLWFALANTSDAPGRSDCYSRWIGAAGTPVARTQHMPRSAWQSQLVIWREVVAPGATIRFEASTSMQGGQIRNARLLGLRTDATTFAHAESDLVETASEALVHELEPPPLAGDRFLRVVTTRVDSDCDSMDVLADREVIFEGGTHSAIAHVVDNCSYETTYGVVELLAEPPARLSTTIRSGNGTAVKATDSTILLIAVPEN